MFVVATAGHVDHGKSTLVRALTGMEPDRWAEERRRGLTIDLGFAWTRLPSGADLAFVDVPGHRRFIGNMLSGIGPAPAVLFVVAADEGWREQSAEHLRAVAALGLRHGVLAVTRADLADPEPALARAAGELRSAGLVDVPAVAVSGVTGAGLPDLVRALETVTARLPVPDPAARVRLWVDRAFTVAGSGTVVTGTLSAGSLAIEDRVELAGPSGTRWAAVRALEALGVPRDRVSAAARVAVNLRRVPADQVRRGDALLTPDAWQTTGVVDVRLPFAESVPGPDLPGRLMLHVGTAAVPVRLRPLGHRALRLTLDRPLPLEPGDRAILREPGGRGVITGVVVIDAEPPVLRRRGAAAAWGASLAAAPERPDLAGAVRRRGMLSVAAARRLGIPGESLEADPPVGVRRIASWYVDEPTWQAWLTRVSGLVDAHAREHPLDPRMTAGAAANALGLPDQRLLEPLAGAAGLEVAGGRIGTPTTRPDLGPVESAVAAIEARLTANPFAAPERGELQEAGLGPRQLAAAAATGRVIVLADDVVLLPSAPAQAMRRLAALSQPFTTSAARQALGSTRRVVIPLLEHLDARGWTRRIDAGQREVVR